MKHLLITLAALSAFTSCSKNDELESGSARKSEIRVTASVDGTHTKAIANSGTGLTGVSFVMKEGATAPADFTNGTAYTGQVAATTGKVKFATAPVYNPSDAIAWFVAYHPGGTLTNNTMEWEIDGKTDIMVTNAVWNAGKYSARIADGLRFNHRLSRIEVVLKAEATVSLTTVQAVWGNIEKIEFLGAPNKMKYDLTAATPTITSSGTVDFALFSNYEGGTFSAMSIPANTSTAVNAVAMLAPVAVTATESFKLKVTATGDGTNPIEVEIPVNIDKNLTPMTAGHTHIVTLTFKANNKKIDVTTSTVDNWMAGTGGTHEVERPEPTIIDYGVAPFDVTSGSFNTATYSILSPTTTSYNNTPTGSYYTDVTTTINSEPPYMKFEVAKEDEGGGEIESWEAALNACKNKTTDGGGWRVPRLSELMLMYLNKDALENTPGFTEFREYSTNYWSVSEYNADYKWYVGFNAGSSLGNNRLNTSYLRVRCIREIPVPVPIIDYGIAPFDKTNGLFYYDTYTIPPPTTTSYNNAATGTYFLSINDVFAGEPPYKKFEVALTNESSGTAWQSAMDACKAKTPVGEWRLPRLSEMMLLWLNSTALKDISGFKDLGFEFYWTATENASNSAWYVDSSRGGTGGEPKNTSYTFRTRCIREIH